MLLVVPGGLNLINQSPNEVGADVAVISGRSSLVRLWSGLYANWD